MYGAALSKISTQSSRPLFSRALKMTDVNGTPPSRGKVLTMQTLNPNIKEMQYAVRGPIVARAGEIEKELQKVWQSTKSERLFSRALLFNDFFRE